MSQLQQPMRRNSISLAMKVLVAQLCLTLWPPWTVTRQAPLSMGFSRQESWSGLPFPSPGDLPNPGMESQFPRLQVDSLTFEPLGKLCLIKAFNGLSDAIHKGRNICFTWSNDLIVHLLQGLPQNTQNSVWSNIWTPNDPVKLTHKK